jgi:hypothetical protein
MSRPISLRVSSTWMTSLRMLAVIVSIPLSLDYRAAVGVG